MMRIVLFVLATLCPSILAAQTISVRSGEHGEFTRLVFDLPEGTTWSLDPAEDRLGATVTFEGTDAGIDTSQIYQRINRDRVADVVANPEAGTVSIGYACACAADAFVLRDRMLVIDIRAAAAQQVQPISQTDPEPSLNRNRPDPGLASDLARVRVAGLPGIGPERVVDPLLPRLPQGPVAGAESTEPSNIAMDAITMGDQIASDLAAAVTEGLLAPSASFRQPGQSNVATIAPIPDPEQVAAGDDLVNQLSAGLAGVDHTSVKPHRIQVGGANCTPDRDLAIAGWIDPDADVSTSLSNRRGLVFGEFDRIDPEALRLYVRTLLHFGFGAEARAAQELLATDRGSPEQALSHILDGDDDPQGFFDGQTNCEGDASMWATLDLADGSGSQMVDVAAVQRAFEKLPVHLREHLGPELSTRLAHAGYPGAARDVLRRLERSKGAETESIALGKAKLDLKQGRLDDAEGPLRTLATSGGPESPEAVLSSIQLAEESGKPVPGYLVELADAFATEFRNDENGPKFWQAHLRALLTNDQFDAVFERLAQAKSDYIDETDVSAMKHRAMAQVTEDAPDFAFLKIATRELAAGYQPEPARLGLAIGQRLLDLGLPDQALDRAVAAIDAGLERDGILLQARSQLALFRPEEAEAALISLQGDDVTELRAEARRQMGDHVFAGTLFSDLGEAERARRSAWLSGDWQSVSEGADDALAQAAALIESPDVVLDPARPSLAGATDLSDASAEARQTIRSLLDATRLEADSQ